MKTLVIGAAGQIGQRIVAQLHTQSNHTPVAQVRRTEQLESYHRRGIEARRVDLEDDVAALCKGMRGCDAVIFSAGSGGATGFDKTLLIDLDGAVKCMEAASACGIRRFVMISAFGADRREDWNPEIKPYYVAKHYADRLLLVSGLDYTIIRPGRLTDEPAKGRVATEPSADGERSIPRADVAQVAGAVLDADNARCKAFDLVSGTQSIDALVHDL
ncbi:SDR family oxidoreductase [Halotalea alkalilenta]|uniref:Sugar epimerase n=1 Tax=Halotalea alkalilenta TaxID=376489 RepID=A0A172YB18_9GAMM|nr:SDR family oxidoreductase [Halotalea alkalilenta]ANF56326.1 sugar epimerase [Halotalea alkalilenta]